MGHSQLTRRYTLPEEEEKQNDFAELLMIQSRQIYHYGIDAIPDMILIVDLSMRIVLVNPAFREWDAGYGKHNELVGKRFPELYPELFDSFFEKVEFVLHTGLTHICETTYSSNNSRYYLEIRKIPIIRNNEIGQIMLICRDITIKKELELLRMRDAEQKEIMLRETHHRVKNNLGIIISMINMQMRNYPSPEFRQPMKNIELRIRSMALIHEYLYRSDILYGIPLSNYLYSLSTAILNTLGEANIHMAAEIEPVNVSVNMALPLGLITNELITNAIKYAFPGHREGELAIRGKREIGYEGYYKLTIEDNGVGLPIGFSVNQPSSSGMLIVTLLAQQLNAKLEIENRHGTSFHIYFKI